MKSASGYSLIELMIVVGVIGVLANFASVQSQALLIKAERSEVVVNSRLIAGFLEATLYESNALPNKFPNGAGERLCNDDIADPGCWDIDFSMNYDNAKYVYYLGTELGPNGWAYALLAKSKRNWGLAYDKPFSLEETAVAMSLPDIPTGTDEVRYSPGGTCYMFDAVQKVENTCSSAMNYSNYLSVVLPFDYVKP